ncbi:glycosyltransferase family 4 protein [Acinetobacter sp. RF14B]|uniref:glycosyltransferase family 4 protein n=1 Tax=Acinetobacter sp. RF14B TaxID=2650965 RepID=UPI0011676CB6|nr:glycosyltransferase family 4 protein [Acinetobacter sp. RF14B]TQR65355.1 glycosyltransferase [Acinetobacter sp. RF14B]
MKIVYVATSFNTTGKKIGGGEISNRDLLENIAQKEDVYVICMHGSNGWNEQYKNIKCYDVFSLFKKIFIFNKISYLISFIFFKFISKILMKKINPDIVLGATESVGIVQKFCEKNKIKCGVFIRAFENFNIEKNLKNSIKKFFYSDFSEITINKMDFIITNSLFMREKCLSMTSVDDIYIVYPAINLKKNPIDTNASIQTIGMVSTRIDKGFNIFKAIRPHFPDIKFIVLGGTEDALDTENNIYIYKWVKNPESVLSKMDLILVPSIIEETFGRISVEALRLGKRVLVSNKGGLPETVNFNNNFIVENDDIMSWVEKVEEVVSFPNANLYDLEEVSSNTLNYTSSIQVKNFYKILNEING